MSEDKLQQEFQSLVDAVLDQRATPEQIRRLEELVLSSAELRHQYADMSHVHACLVLLGNETVGSNLVPEHTDRDPFVPPTASREATPLTPFQQNSSSQSSWSVRWVVITMLGTTAAAVLLTVYLLPETHNQPDTAFATLISANGCRWESTSVPTDQGTRIGKGRLRLAEGLSTIRFDNGVRVDLEGPVDLEIQGIDRCRLHEGKLVATSDEGFQGFIVETPNAILTDQGTSFGVHVSKSGLSNLEVFDGQVDVKHRSSGEVASFTENSIVRLSEETIERLESPEPFPLDEPKPPKGKRLVQISTAIGNGRDHWIQRNNSKRSGPESLLLVKSARPWYKGYDRKAYLGFDLSSIGKGRIKEATLQLTAVPTGMGYASRMPDATLAVYGIVDESLDNWNPEAIDWNTAPGNTNSSSSMGKQKTTLLGRFELPRGRQRGVYSITGNSLRDFLLSDTNGFVTLVIVSETRPIEAGALVHGFASRSHESQLPPTLRLWVDE